MVSPIVAVGASAGGLDALFELFASLPASTGAAYVVVQHLDREHKDLLAELLAKKTRMPVAQVEHGAEPKPDRVFVIPPNTRLTLSDNQFHLAPRGTSSAPHHPVDVFFESLAGARAGAAIGVVLSGGDADGALGVKAIKTGGGITIAQSPESAKFPGMPQGAIDSGCVDYVLRPAEIANEIVRLSRHPYLLANDASAADLEPLPVKAAGDEDNEFRRVFRRLRSAHGVDFTNYKRSTLRRRLARRMALNRIGQISEYVDRLEDDTCETLALYQDFLIRVTGFFRDPEMFVALRAQVFPAICDDRKPDESIRIWVAGCATGEEVYSIAIALVDYLGDSIPARRIQIFGTDVSETSVELARAGVYRDHIAADVPGEMLARHFVKVGDSYQVTKRIRDLCIFARHDVTRDPPFSRIDLLTCRNLLIYLDGGAQRRVMRAFHYALSPGAFMALGLSEGVGSAKDLFELLDKRHRIYSRKTGAGSVSLDGPERVSTSSGQSRSVESQDLSATADTDSVQREADRALLARYSPASLLVDDALNILQFRGETGRYVEHASGPPSLNLHRVVRPQLLVELSPAIQEARDSGIPVWREGVTLDEQSDIVLGVIPLRSRSAERSFLIVFESAALATAKRSQLVAVPILTESEKDRRIAQLERELVSTRGFLQTTMEEQEAVRDELKSAHEEVLSANEEFQSTNEELETAKEELQSFNEELTTTNDELLNRNRELSDLNAELLRTQQVAVRAQEHADAIVASTRDPLLVLDSDLRVLRANQSFYKEFGLKREATEGTVLGELRNGLWAAPELRNRLERVLTQDVAVVDYELDCASDPGTKPKIFRIDAKKIPSAADRVELLLLAIEDVTERRSHAQALELANQRKDEFLAMLAHELRNPLTPITHAIHLLQREGFEGSSATLHKMIGRQTRRLIRLVDDLLDLARINRGHIELRNSLVDMTNVVRDAAESARVRMDERRQVITIAVPEAPVCVDGDAVRLEQIVSNLLDNAAKYTNPGGRIDVNLTEQRGEAVLSVSDNGIGLAPHDLARIFELFDQVDKSLSRSGGGLGIGLTLVRRVLKLHGGTVEARSAGLGYGAEFIVRLPISQREKPRPTESGDDSCSTSSERTRRVLIVDDNVDAVDSLRLLAQHWGHDVVVAHSGPEAIAAVDTFHPETALVDIGLPGISGYEVARVLRLRHPKLFLVAMTGYGRDEDRKIALEAGFDAHLLKPADLEVLEALLARGHQLIRH